MTPRETIALLYRRAGFGLSQDALDAAEGRGVAAEIDRLVDPAASGIPLYEDPWDDAYYEAKEPGGQAIPELVGSWMTLMRDADRTLEEWMAWFWSGHLVTEFRVVRFPALMVRYLRTLRESALGNFGELLRAITTDGAMLIYLDGTTSTGESPNENYSREILELFALGVGNYTEADVGAGANSLTGWVVGPRRGIWNGRFVDFRHNDVPQTYLGQSGVNDVDSVIDAILDHDACASFIAGKLASEILGPGVPSDVTADLANDFRGSGYEIRPLVRSILEIAADQPDAVSPMVLGPLPWFIQAERATGAVFPESRLRIGALELAGQLPLAPPNVAGWPGGGAWFASSTVIARLNIAGFLAASTPPESAVALAAAASDFDGLADALGRPEGFIDTTKSALAALPSGAATERIAIALTAPDMVIG